MRNTRKFAFTLIELITVMAITAILLTIITVPMIQTFNATRTAQAFSDAQAKAQLLTERLTKEIGEAVAVREVEGASGRVSIVAPIPASGVDDNGTVQATAGGFVKVSMNYTKMDLVMAQKIGQRGPGGGFIDPTTGKEDPTLKSAKGQVQLPLAAGTTIKRYWIGLRDPFRNYNNPYDGMLMPKQGGRDNLFVLWSAEVEPVVMVETPAGSGNYIPQVNTKYFDAVPDGTNRTPILDDPDFFLATNAATGTPVNNDAKATRVNNWLKVAKVETEVTRYDMIQPQFDRGKMLVRVTNAAGNWSPRITPLITFRPSHVESDGVDAQVAASLGSEFDGSDQVGSEVFTGQYGLMSNLVVRSYGPNWNTPGDTAYQISRKDNNNQQIFYVDPTNTSIPDTTSGSGIMTFDISAYEDAFRARQYDAASRYPFTVGLDAANSLSGWLSSANADLRLKFMPFATNTLTGKIIGSFNIAEVGDYTRNPDQASNLFNTNDLNTLNLPQVPAQSTSSSGWTNTEKGLTPTTDPAVAGVFSDTPYWDSTFNRFNINRVFNKIVSDAKANRNGVPAQLADAYGAHRFIDLRTIPQGDGTASPLAMFPRAIITPGSEEVKGPDQNPGPNNGYEVRYKRVNREPGPNEYRINYTNLQEPTAAGYAALGFPVPPAAYDRTSLVSAIYQPRFKVGYIQLCSLPEVPIPATMRLPGTLTDVPGRIRVSYKFQFTAPDDVVRVEYDTRQLMQVVMTIRNYPQSDVPFPQSVTMKATANVHNFIR